MSQPARSATRAAGSGGGGPCQSGAIVQRRGRGAPGGGAETVGEAVPGEVEPGAGAELGGGERQAGERGHGQEAGAERGGALRLVGLRRPLQAVEEIGRLRGEGGLHGRPERRVVGVVRGIDRGEAGGASFEHEAVQAAGQPQGKGVGARVSGPVQHPVGHGSAAGQPVGEEGAEPGGEGRAHAGAGRGLEAEGFARGQRKRSTSLCSGRPVFLGLGGGGRGRRRGLGLRGGGRLHPLGNGAEEAGGVACGERRRPFGDGGEEVVDPLGVGLGEVAEDVVGDEALVAGMADAEADAGEVRPDVGGDRADAVVAGGAAAGLGPHPAGREVELVVEDGDVAGLELVELRARRGRRRPRGSCRCRA